MNPEAQNTGRIFTIAVAAVAVAAALGCLVVLVALGPSAADKAELTVTRDAMAEVNARPGPLPTQKVVDAWKKYRSDLSGVRGEVDDFYRKRDGNLEQYFDQFDPRSGGDRFRQLYREKAAALYEKAAPVVVKDRNGNPAPMKEVFSFEDWSWSPGQEEFRLAQRRFNVQDMVVDEMLELAEAKAPAGIPAFLEPVLLSIRFASVADEKSAAALSMPCTIEALVDPRQVEALVAGVAGPGGHGLLAGIDRIAVAKTATHDLSYSVTVKPGEEPKLRREGFIRQVKVTLVVGILDIPDAEK